MIHIDLTFSAWWLVLPALLLTFVLGIIVSVFMDIDGDW